MFFLPALVQAQEHRLELRTGYTRSDYLDRGASDFRYVAHRAVFDLDYRYTASKGSWTAGLGAGYGSMYTASYPDRKIAFANWNWDGTYDVVEVPVRGSMYSWNIHAGRLFRVNSSSKPLENRTELGPVLRWNVMYIDGFIPAGMMSAASLAFRFEKQHAWNKHSIGFAAELPLLAAVSRLPYHGSVSSPGVSTRVGGFFSSGTRFATLNTYQELTLRLNYRYALGKRTALGLEYAPSFCRYTLPREVRYLHNSFRILLHIKL